MGSVPFFALSPGKKRKNTMAIILASHLHPCGLLPCKKSIFGSQRNQQNVGVAVLYILVNSLDCFTLPETSHGYSHSIPHVRISVTDT